jgi:hypothetical protein
MTLLLSLGVTVATVIGFGFGVFFRHEGVARTSGLLAVAALIAATAGQMLHGTSRPVAPPECYTTPLGSTSYCTRAQMLNLVEVMSWSAAAASAAACVALLVSVSVRIFRLHPRLLGR